MNDLDLPLITESQYWFISKTPCMLFWNYYILRYYFTHLKSWTYTFCVENFITVITFCSDSYYFSWQLLNFVAWQGCHVWSLTDHADKKHAELCNERQGKCWDIIFTSQAPAPSPHKPEWKLFYLLVDIFFYLFWNRNQTKVTLFN